MIVIRPSLWQIYHFFLFEQSKIDEIFQKVTSKFLVVRKKCYLCKCYAIVAQLVEHWLPKPRVAGSSPVYRSHKTPTIS